MSALLDETSSELERSDALETLLAGVDEDLPQILGELELPPPLSPRDRFIGRSVLTGRGSFRLSTHASLVTRLKNEQTIEELRSLQLQVVEDRATVSGSGYPVALESLLPVSSASVESPTVEEQGPVEPIGFQVVQAQPSGDPVPLISRGTVSQVKASVGPDEWAVESDLSSPSVQGALWRKQMALKSAPAPDLPGVPETVQFDWLARNDLRGKWALVREGELVAIYKDRPGWPLDEAATVIPASETYREPTYEHLLSRRSQISVEQGVGGSEPELTLLDAMLDFLSIERSWENLNLRRQHLIIKKNSTGLTEGERLEFERLQKVADQRISVYAPPPVDGFLQIEEYLRSSGLDPDRF